MSTISLMTGSPQIYIIARSNLISNYAPYYLPGLVIYARIPALVMLQFKMLIEFIFRELRGYFVGRIPLSPLPPTYYPYFSLYNDNNVKDEDFVDTHHLMCHLSVSFVLVCYYLYSVIFHSSKF